MFEEVVDEIEEMDTCMVLEEIFVDRIDRSKKAYTAYPHESSPYTARGIGEKENLRMDLAGPWVAYVAYHTWVVDVESYVEKLRECFVDVENGEVGHVEIVAYQVGMVLLIQMGYERFLLLDPGFLDHNFR